MGYQPRVGKAIRRDSSSLEPGLCHPCWGELQSLLINHIFILYLFFEAEQGSKRTNCLFVSIVIILKRDYTGVWEGTKRFSYKVEEMSVYLLCKLQRTGRKKDIDTLVVVVFTESQNDSGWKAP